MIRSLSRAVVALFSSVAAVASAADFPTKPIRVFLGYPAGGSSDVLVRTIAQGMSQKLGQPVVVENRPGANTLLATQAVAQSAPDGYTLLYTASPLVQQPVLSKSWNVDPLADLAPIIQVVQLPVYFVINPGKLPNVRTMQDFIAYAKANPSKVNISTAGTDLGYRLFNHLAGTNIQFVPFKGEAPAVQAVMAGETQLTYGALPSVQPQAAAGTLKLLAVSSRKRFPGVPDVPTLDEVGLKGYEFVIWHGMLGATKTPANVVSTINGTVAEVLRAPDLNKRLTDQGFFVIADKPEEFRASLAAELGTWKKLAGALGVVPE